MEGSTHADGTIGWAVATLRLGGRVKRRRWSGMYLVYTPPTIMQVAQGEPDPYHCLQADLLATDWEEVT